MKVPKPRKLSSGNWFIQLRLGGESISVTEPTEKKCIKSAQLIKAEYLSGKRLSAQKQNTTLSQAIDKYISSRENVLSPSTIRGYRIIQRTRFQNVMDSPISSILDWQKIVNSEAKLCSAKTLHNSWMFIASVIMREIGTRPTVTLPQIPKNERPYLSPRQIDIFVRAVNGTSVEIPALLGLCSLRCSEILGLYWKNVDLENGTVHVQGATVRGEDGKLIHKNTNKNTSSDRIVPIMPQLLNALRSVPTHNPDDLVVNCSQNSIYTRVNTICRNNDLPEIGVHGLRHSFASLAYHLGIPYKVAMEIGGWSDDYTMQKIYTHIAQEYVHKSAVILIGFYTNQKNANENANENAN